MNTAFKTALRQYLFDGVYITPTLLANIPTWPLVHTDVQYNEDEPDEDDYEDDELEYIAPIQNNDFPNMNPLSLQDCEFMDYTDTTLKIYCCGNGQEPHVVILALFGDQIIVESCEIHAQGVLAGPTIHSHELEAMFTGIRVRPAAERPVAPTPKWVYEMDLKKAIAREDYKEAARIRDLMNG